MQAPQTERQSLRWFGSSGIRGPLDEVGPALGLRLGRALGARYRSVIVGHDARLSGPALTTALIAGLLSSGAHVRRVGILPTPALAFLARQHDLGVQVTASHNPSPDNGFKLWLPNGAAPGDRVLRDIEADMEALPALADWRGSGTETHSPGAAGSYTDAVLRHVQRRSGPRPLAGHRIALDCAHGAGATLTPRLLSTLGAETTVLGGSPDGRFPDHPSEPDEAHLGNVSTLLAAGGHSFGIAHDGDADRTVFLTPDGRRIPPERLLAVIAEMRGDTHIALPVDASGIVADHLPDARIEVTPVGDIHLSRALDEGRATIGCEPSGTWFFAEWIPTPEGPFAAAYIAACLAQDPELLDRIDDLPTYARVMRKIRLPKGTERKTARDVVGRAAAALTDLLDPRSTSSVDGTRIETDDGWVLVRPSGTEPVVRVTTEARKEARAEALADRGERAIREALEMEVA